MFKVDVKVSPDFEKKLGAAMEKKVEEHVRDRLRSLRCPVHGQAPTVVRKGSSPKIEFDIRGCCTALKDAAARALK